MAPVWKLPNYTRSPLTRSSLERGEASFLSSISRDLQEGVVFRSLSTT